jgi:hypothetical protein
MTHGQEDTLKVYGDDIIPRFLAPLVGTPSRPAEPASGGA